jgi:hypothetical protein
MFLAPTLAPSQMSHRCRAFTHPFQPHILDRSPPLIIVALPELVGQRPINKPYCHRMFIGVEPLGGFLVFFPRRNRLKPPFLMQGTTYPTKGGRAIIVSAVGHAGQPDHGVDGPGIHAQVTVDSICGPKYSAETCFWVE